MEKQTKGGLEPAEQYQGGHLQGIDQAAMRASQRIKERHCSGPSFAPMPGEDWSAVEKDYRDVDRLRRRGNRGGQMFGHKDMISGGESVAQGRRKKNWIGEARASMVKRGTVGSYGHHTVAQMKRDVRKGGKIGRKANFALNTRKRKRGASRR